MTPDPEHVLMARIHEKWDAALVAALEFSPLPKSLLAAIMAGESGGNPQITRFEIKTFESLCLVLLGRRGHFMPAGIQHFISTKELTDWLTAAAGKDFAAGLVSLARLATSYGLLQIMGWHAVEFGRPLSLIMGEPAEHLSFGVFLATYFSNRYLFDLTKDFEKLLRCWNTGEPEGQTYDPQYVPRGLARMTIYEEIAAAAPPPADN